MIDLNLKKIIFCVSGNGTLMKEAVLHKKLIGIEPVLCIAESKASELLDSFCQKWGVPLVRLDPADRISFNDKLLKVCVELNPDFIALTFDRLVNKEFVETFKSKIINMHFALLPSFEGFNSIPKAITHGVKFYGHHHTFC